MPELPEVETTRRSLLPHMVGQCVEQVVLRRKTLRFPIPDDFTARLQGRCVLNIRRRAKYLLFELDSGDRVLAHLGMSGSFRVVALDAYHPKTHDHVLWQLGNGTGVVYHDPRRFGMLDMLTEDDEKKHKLLKDIGVEPLSHDFSVDYLEKALSQRSAPIKTTLMDQKIVVGVGNIYASESLFLAGVHPAMMARVVAKHSVTIISAIQKTLRAAIDAGGSTLRDYVTADHETGYFQHQFNVYQREGLPCVSCATPVARMVQAGRATYFCPHCQKQFSQKRSPHRRAGKKT